MPDSVLDMIMMYADTQGMLINTTDQEVVFKPHFARKMLVAVADLYRWYRLQGNALRLLQLRAYTPPYIVYNNAGGQPSRAFHTNSANSANRSRSGHANTMGAEEDEGDMMETTDAAGEEGEEGIEEVEEDEEEEASDFEGDFQFVAPDQDTETEMAVEDEGAENLDDSDSEGDVANANHHAVGNANLFSVGL